MGQVSGVKIGVSKMEIGYKRTGKNEKEGSGDVEWRWVA